MLSIAKSDVAPESKMKGSAKQPSPFSLGSQEWSHRSCSTPPCLQSFHCGRVSGESVPHHLLRHTNLVSFGVTEGDYERVQEQEDGRWPYLGILSPDKTFLFGNENLPTVLASRGRCYTRVNHILSRRQLCPPYRGPPSPSQHTETERAGVPFYLLQATVILVCFPKPPSSARSWKLSAEKYIRKKSCS